MATKLVNSMPIQNARHFKGGSLVIFGSTATPPAWPTKLEDIIDLSTGALMTGYSYAGATDENGAETSREWDRDEGQATDQRSYNLRRGAIRNWRMGASFSLLYSDSTAMKRYWGLGTALNIAAGTGVVAQIKTNIGAPGTLEEAIMVILQQDEDTKKLYAEVFRKSQVASAGPVRRNGQGMAVIPVTMTLEADSAQTDGTDFGIILESSLAVLTS